MPGPAQEQKRLDRPDFTDDHPLAITAMVGVFVAMVLIAMGLMFVFVPPHQPTISVFTQYVPASNGTDPRGPPPSLRSCRSEHETSILSCTEVEGNGERP